MDIIAHECIGLIESGNSAGVHPKAERIIDHAEQAVHWSAQIALESIDVLDRKGGSLRLTVQRHQICFGGTIYTTLNQYERSYDKHYGPEHAAKQADPAYSSTASAANGLGVMCCGSLTSTAAARSNDTFVPCNLNPKLNRCWRS